MDKSLLWFAIIFLVLGQVVCAVLLIRIYRRRRFESCGGGLPPEHFNTRCTTYETKMDDRMPRIAKKRLPTDPHENLPR